jgi:transposase-like protein
MKPMSFKRHRIPPEIFRYAVWAYFRFTMSLGDVEDLLAQRGVHVSYETIRNWTLKFGRRFAWNLRRGQYPPAGRRHLDEVVVTISGRQMYLCGPSMMKAKCRTSWCSVDGIRERPSRLSAGS